MFGRRLADGSLLDRRVGMDNNQSFRIRPSEQQSSSNSIKRLRRTPSMAVMVACLDRWLFMIWTMCPFCHRSTKNEQVMLHTPNNGRTRKLLLLLPPLRTGYAMIRTTLHGQRCWTQAKRSVYAGPSGALVTFPLELGISIRFGASP